VKNTREVKVSGRMVLICLVAFFAVIAGVNALMATLAIKTFGGVEAENAYRAGLEFARELSSSRAQQERNIKVDVTTSRTKAGIVKFRMVVQGTEGSVSSLQANLELRHPADKRRDHKITLTRNPDGAFTAETEVEPGQWNALISLERGGERLFRSVNRVTIP
jgi:nitrogen fixation protein FixH